MIFFIWLVLAGSALAHELRPVFLEFREMTKDNYRVTLKVPALGPERRLPLTVTLPADCSVVSPPTKRYLGNAYSERWVIHRSGGLAGAEIGIEGLNKTLTDALVRVEYRDGTSSAYRLTSASSSLKLSVEPSRGDVALAYTRLGVQHILEGWDHLLFVLCLMLVSGLNRKLVVAVTGFTLAHSATLVLATLDLVRLPIAPVEATIALSIVFLANEIARGDRDGVTYRYPVAVAASFGLLHGFGFASVLGEIGLPRGEVPWALFFFNVGVEVGQLVFIILLAAGYLLLRRVWLGPTQRATKLLAYLIGACASFWLIERILAFIN